VTHSADGGLVNGSAMIDKLRQVKTIITSVMGKFKIHGLMVVTSN